MRAVVGIAVVGLGLAAACTFMPAPVPPTADLAKIVEATLAAQGINMPPTSPALDPPTLVVVAPTEVQSTPTPVVLVPGSISGSLSYPGSVIPPLLIVAFRGEGGPRFSVEVPQGSATYTIGDVPPGIYHVVAYVVPSASEGILVGLAAGYSNAVACGLRFGCDDHGLLPVVVGSGEAVTGIDPQDWYAPEGTFPPMPD
ncbi:MAG: hypothetical protein A2Z30_04575 [Chloroflexi bacterium RBG_16_64_43]|nr:MAG: hypothetical protein A2Z30_04575 [Chloroflexi bacterium RBG_16_64_43]